MRVRHPVRHQPPRLSPMQARRLPPAVVGGSAGTTVAGAPAAAPATPAGAPLTPIENVPVNPPATTPADSALATAEAEDWSLPRAETTGEGYEASLRRYRRGPHARDARNAIAELNRLSPPAVPAA